MRMVRALALLGGAFLAAGCATRSQVRNAPPDAGARHSYAADFAKVRTAALTTLAESDFAIREEGWMEADRWRFLASQGLATGTVGRYARVVIESHPTDCRVWIVVQSKIDNSDTRAADAAIGRGLLARLGLALGLEPPASPAPAPVSRVEEAERLYGVSMTPCAEAVIRVLHDLGYGAPVRDRAGEVLQTVSASDPDGRRLFVALYPQGAARTRAVVDTATPEDARKFHDALARTLSP